MNASTAMKINQLPTPVYVIDEDKLTDNLRLLHRVESSTGCKILLAQKAFSAFCVYPLIGQYLSGTTASGLYEARLGKEEMGKENHIFCPAYLDGEFDEIAQICDHIVFNSFAQKEKFGKRCGRVSIGLRVNPEFSTQESAIYDPCAPGSRLGITKSNFREDLLDGVEGLHMHTLCEQGADALAATVRVFEEKFGSYLGAMRWLNLGGGHHITKPGNRQVFSLQQPLFPGLSPEAGFSSGQGGRPSAPGGPFSRRTGTPPGCPGSPPRLWLPPGLSRF